MTLLNKKDISMSLHSAMVKVRAAEEYDLLLRMAAAATKVINESSADKPPSLGSMAALADAVHAHWKFMCE